MQRKPYIFNFEHEDEHFSSLEWIPYSVRYQLDCLAKKLSLSAWQSFPLEVRVTLQQISFEDSLDASSLFNTTLCNADTLYSNSSLKECSIDSSIWQENSHLPLSIVEKCLNYTVTISAEQWNTFSPFIKYTLYKASTGKNSSTLEKILRELHYME